MNICKAALTVAKRHWVYIVLYLIGLSLVMTTMLVQSVSKSNGSSPSFSPSRSTVAIVDRDGDAGGIATGLRDYLAQSNNIVHVDDNTRALQDAVISGGVKVIYVVPQGYMRDFADAVSSGQPPKRLDAMFMSQDETSDVSEIRVSTFLANLCTTYLAVNDASSQGRADRADSLNAGGGSASSGAKDVSIVREQSLSASTGSLMHQAVTQVVSAGNQARSDAHISVVGTHHASGSASATSVFGLSMTLGCYPIVASMIVVIAMVIGAFAMQSTRRRMNVSPVEVRSVGLSLLVACACIGVLVTAYYVLLSLVLTVVMTGSLNGLTLRPVLLATCSLAAYVFFAISIGFILGRLAVSSSTANGIANVVGLVIASTSGAWSFGTSVMTGPVATIGKMLCGRWYVDAIDRAMSIGSYANGSLNLGGWAISTGIVALFAITLACVGLNVTALKRSAVSNKS